MRREAGLLVAVLREQWRPRKLGATEPDWGKVQVVVEGFFEVIEQQTKEHEQKGSEGK